MFSIIFSNLILNITRLFDIRDEAQLDQKDQPLLYRAKFHESKYTFCKISLEISLYSVDSHERAEYQYIYTS